MAEFTKQVSDPTFYSSSPGSGGSRSSSSSSSIEGELAAGISGLAGAAVEFAATRQAQKNKELEGQAFLDFYDAASGGGSKEKVLTDASKMAASISSTAAQTGDYTTARTNALAEMRRWVAANPAYSRELSGIFQLATGKAPGDLYADVQADQAKAQQEQEEYLRSIPGDNPTDPMELRLERAATFSTDVERNKLAMQKKLLIMNKKGATQEEKDEITNELLESSQSLGLRDIYMSLDDAMAGFDPNEDPELRNERLGKLMNIQAAAALNTRKITEGSSQSEVQFQEVMGGINLLINNAVETIDGKRDLSFFENWNKVTQLTAESKVRFENKDLVRGMAIMSVMGGPQGLSMLSLTDRQDLLSYIKRVLPAVKNILGGGDAGAAKPPPVINSVTSALATGNKNQIHKELKSLYKGVTPLLTHPEAATPEQWKDMESILKATNEGLEEHYELVPNETKKATIEFYANPAFVKAPVAISDSPGLVSVLNNRVKELSRDLVNRYKDASQFSATMESQIEFKVNATGTGIEAVPRKGAVQMPGSQQPHAAGIIREINTKYVPEFNKAIRAYAHVYQKNTDYKVAAQTLISTGGLSEQEAGVEGEFSQDEEKKELKTMLMSDPKVQAAIEDGSRTEADIDAAIEERFSQK